MAELQDMVAEYCTSEHFLFLSPALKPHAESLLAHWCSAVDRDPANASDAALKTMASFDLPTGIRRAVPSLLIAFLEFAGTTGRCMQATSLADSVRIAETEFVKSIRDDGSVKGETFKKNYTDVGRNDPCPCGSGRKFKQCCMKLIR